MLVVKNQNASAEIQVQFLGWEDPLEAGGAFLTYALIDRHLLGARWSDGSRDFYSEPRVWLSGHVLGVGA